MTSTLTRFGRVLAPIAVVALLAVGCGDDDDDAGSASGTGSGTGSASGSGSGSGSAAGSGSGSATGSGAATGSETTRPVPTGPASVAVATNPALGPILVDGTGLTLYLFEQDRDASTCYGACARAWPPLLTVGAPAGGEGVNGTLLGTTTRDDGSAQVTYAGKPLYYYHDDVRAGDITGNDKDEYGAEWYAVKPDGVKVGG